jgi:3-oxoacyl-[acyl-carrier protein] reductase
MTQGMQLEGKTALITGAGRPRGIGQAIARAFLEQGANVVLSDLAGVTTAVAEQARFGVDHAAGRMRYAEANVCDPSDAHGIVETAVTHVGGWDILINNAGVGRGSPDFMELTEEDWTSSIAVNLHGTATMCTAAMDRLRQSSSACIINVASLSGLRAIPHIPACYTASKFAVVGLTKQIALQLAPENIRVNAICPGSVRTDMMEVAMDAIAEAEGIDTAQAEALEASTIALGRVAEPDEIGKLAVFLASENASYITGEAMVASGGMHNGL